MFKRINTFLDQYVLPWPVRFLTFRFVILATIALLLPLIVYADHTELVLLLNSYLNVMSVAVSSIVLLYATISEVRQKQIADLQEQRAQEDHQHVTEMHQLVFEAIANQHEELHELKELIAAMQGKTAEHEALEPVPDLQSLHPRGAERFENDDAQERLDRLHQNPLVNTLRPDPSNDDEAGGA
jgi:hypothetical protein